MPRTGLHLHNQYEIYLLIEGEVDYYVEDQKYHIGNNDLVITNTEELHMAAYRNTDCYARYCIRISPAWAELFSTEKTDLSACFTERKKAEHNVFRLNFHEREQLFRIFEQMEQLPKISFGSDLLLRACVEELLLCVNTVFLTDDRLSSSQTSSQILADVLNAIKQTLSEDHHDEYDTDITVSGLARKFFVNPDYLRILFKKNFGISLSEYITICKISNAKNLLRQGCSVSYTCQKCGFSDYSAFIRTFHRIVGISPGKYGRIQ